ncbi:MAG: hypothetical protein ABSB76_38440 [Streptosporangiaceae bacterium]|jgi:hypothetical protein
MAATRVRHHKPNPWPVRTARIRAISAATATAATSAAAVLRTVPASAVSPAAVSQRWSTSADPR